MANVRVLHMITGADVIAQVTDRGSDIPTLELKEAQLLVLRPNGPNSMGVQFVPFFPYTNGKTISLPKSAVILNEEAAGELSNQYNTMFGSGIVLAQAGAVPALNGDGHGGLANTRIL